MAATTAPRWSERVDVHQPTTGAAVGSVPVVTRDDLDAAVGRIGAAQAAERRFVHRSRDERGIRTLRSLRDRLE